MRQSIEVLISHVFPTSRWTSDSEVDAGCCSHLEIWALFPWARVSVIHVLLRWQLPTKFIGVLTVCTASVPVAGYPGVSNQKVPLGAQLQGFEKTLAQCLSLAVNRKYI